MKPSKWVRKKRRNLHSLIVTIFITILKGLVNPQNEGRRS
jgi:hypothetical protein